MAIPKEGRIPVSGIVLTPKQLQALGMVVAESTYVESLVDSMLRKLLRISPEQFVAVSGGAMMAKKLQMLEEVGSIRLKRKAAKIREQFEGIITTVKMLNNERNTVVHGIWVPVRPSNQGIHDYFIKTGEAEALHKANSMSAQKLAALAQRMSDAYWDLQDFNSHVWINPLARAKVVRALLKSRGLHRARS